ncbi:MAG: hypothetical protein KGH75_11690 [Rhodospirillales bacterium]|nr:hypothetical protein [Rhodospirillales bacterium]
MISRRILAAVALACLFVSPALAQKTKAQLTTEIGTTYPDNTVGSITPLGVRTYETDVLNSIMPTAPVVSGNLACFNGTTGLLQDCGSAPTTVPLTVGTTPISGGTSGNFVYDNAGKLGEITIVPLANGGFGASQSAATANQIPVFPGSGGGAVPTTLLTSAVGAWPGSGDPSVGIGMNTGHLLPWLDENNVLTGNGVFPLIVAGSNPYIIGASGSTINSAVNGDIYSVRFTSSHLTGSPITISYTANGTDTTSTIASNLCTNVNANSTLYTNGLPLFCQATAGGKFNIQWSSVALPDLALASTGTGSITLAGPTTTLDFAVTILGRKIPGYTGQNNDNVHCLETMGQSTSGALDAVLGQICSAMPVATAGNITGNMTFSNSLNGAAVGEFAIQNGIALFDDTGALPVGGYLGRGKINLPSVGGGGIYIDGGTAQMTSTGLIGNNLWGGSAAGSALNLQSTISGAPSGDFVQITTGGVVRQKVFSDGGVTFGAATGGDTGANTINVAASYFRNGKSTATVTTQTFTTGTNATYTTPAGVSAIEVELMGGGGGGAGSGTSPGSATAGGNTCWNTSGTACTTPLYQAGGGALGATNGAAAAGGTVSGSSTCNDSQAGGAGAGATGSTGQMGGMGGSSRYSAGNPGGLIAASPQPLIPPNSGAGGGGAGDNTTANTGGGGGGGAWCYFVIVNPAASYAFTVGPAGTAGTAGTSGFAGGGGAAGKVRVVERYN